MAATATLPINHTASPGVYVRVAGMARSYTRTVCRAASVAPQPPRSASLLILPVRERGRDSWRMVTWRGTL